MVAGRIVQHVLSSEESGEHVLRIGRAHGGRPDSATCIV